MVIEMNSECNNFRAENIYPTLEELSGAGKFFRQNIVYGGFASVHQYLDIQFRLLREDFVAHLREAIDKYKTNKQTTNRLDIYKNICIRQARDKKNEKCFKITAPKCEEDNKKFMNGSLLLFTKNNFQTMFLAKVIQKSQTGEDVTIELLENGESMRLGQLYQLAECSQYFDPYFQVLNAIQNLPTRNFPMAKYIIQVDKKSVYAPKYLLQSNMMYTIKGRLYHASKLPTTNLLNLNTSQIRAFIAALTEEFVVIQGPPGTGKTHLGITITTTLIQNYHLWYKFAPLLVIAQKNDSLDQFLEGLLPITQRLVRVGSQSKSTLLKPFNIATEMKKDGTFKRRNRDCYLATMQAALVVGMTTSVAARWKEDLVRLGSPIMIVEEAAEVFEGHVIAALTDRCQHLILIGDHQQLQPITADHNIGKKYKLEISLFERMVLNKVQHYQLDVQHRMRPEISELLRIKIYPFLIDHHTVLTRPSILGVTKNVFFFDHNYAEETCNITTKKNEFEAAFLINLARYFIMNGYRSEQVVILATYLAQVQELEEFKEGQVLLDGVKISTLDGFQGQEADIVLLSLVRSDGIGFLAQENRVCVALSRARNGFFIVGNMSMLSQRSKLWRSIKNTLQKQQAIGKSLTLVCQKHQNLTEIETLGDFYYVNNGGCSVKCQTLLTCGHVCCLLCHIPDFIEHKCYKGCVKTIKKTNRIPMISEASDDIYLWTPPDSYNYERNLRSRIVPDQSIFSRVLENFCTIL